MNVVTATWTGTLFVVVLLINSFLFWWAFFEEETFELNIDIEKESIDPLTALPIFIEWNLRKLYLLQIRCQFMLTIALLVRKNIHKAFVMTLLKISSEEA